MTIIGLITARGGSKSVPGKNISPLAGKPLIAWTIEAALRCKELNRVIVSTDDEKIAKIAQQWGAEVPFIRPAELAQDASSHISVVLHAIHWLEEKEGFCPDYIMLLQPTSPFRTVEDMRKTIQLAKTHNAVAVVSVCEATKHPYKTFKLIENGTIEYFIPSNIEYMYRQALPKVYEENGAIYLNTRESLLTGKTFLPKGSMPYFMPKERSIDVDTLWDFYLAELILKDKLKRKNWSPPAQI